MNILEPNITNNINEIIDVLSSIYGNEYKSIIKSRFNKIDFIYYPDIDGLKSYYKYINLIKDRELSIKFLNSIGIDIKVDNYVDEFPKEVNELLNKYLGGYYNIFNMKEFSPTGINSFRPGLKKYSKSFIKREQIKYLKRLLNDKNINHFNLDNYILSSSSRINRYIKTIDELLKEKELFLKDYNYILEYIEYTNNKIETINSFYKTKLINRYKDLLDKKYHNILLEMYENDLEYESKIEFFSSKYESLLNNECTPDNIKSFIKHNRMLFFKTIGINISNSNYDQIINNDFIKSYIPDKNIIDKLIKTKQVIIEKAKRTNIYENDYFINYCNNKEYYHMFMENENAITYEIKNYILKRILFLCINKNSKGYLDYLLLHELIHAAESKITNGNEVVSGFDKVKGLKEYNQYNNKFRKYERFNETITDILAIEARKKLQDKNIYILEDKNIVNNNAKDFNTSSILKELVYPFLNTYKKEILEFRMTGNSQKFFETVNKDDFEKINDIVNRIDYLITNFIKDDEYIYLINELNTIYNKMNTKIDIYKLQLKMI